MIYRLWVLIYFFILAAANTGNVYAQQTLYIENGKEEYPLGIYSSILEDKEGKLSIDQAASDSLKDKYVYYNKETINFRFTESSYWVRFVVIDTLSNPATGMMARQRGMNWILIKHEQLLEDVKTYYKNPYIVGNEYIEIKAGSMFPVRKKVIKTDGFIANILVTKNQPITVYLRIKSKSQLIISFRMLTEGEYIILSSKKNMFQGILFGIFFILIAYNTLLYFAIKDKVYIFYVLYIFNFALFIFTSQGYYLEIIGRMFYNDYFIFPLMAVTASGSIWLLLTREFLSTKLYIPWAHKPLAYLTVIAPICFISIFIFSAPWVTILLSVSLLSYYIIGIVVAVIALKKGVYLSKYYLLSLVGITLSIFISLTARNNYLPLPFDFWTQNALSIGILWEALILAAAVGYRFNLVKTEKENEKMIIRNQIASDLHDEIGSNLSTIALQSRMMIKNKNLDSTAKKQLQEIINIAAITTDTIRDIVWFINPFHDKSESLVLRMREYNVPQNLDKKIA